MTTRLTLIAVEDLEAAALRARALILEAAQAALATQPRFSLCVDGGRPTQRLLERLTDAALDWKRVTLWLGDERRVPRDDSRSNRGKIERILLSKLAPAPLFRAPDGAAPDGAQAAGAFERQWRSENPAGVDFLVLGMGPDGHTASLFPHSPALADPRLVVHVAAPTTVEPRVDRLTLTPTAILAARGLALFAVGAEKRAALQRLVAEAGDEAETPARLIRRYAGRAMVIADRAAQG